MTSEPFAAGPAIALSHAENQQFASLTLAFDGAARTARTSFETAEHAFGFRGPY